MPLVTMLCAFFVAPLQAQGQSVEAYVQMSADKTTLTFFYDTKRATREGTTWGIEEKKEDHGWQIPAWSSTYNNPNTTTTKAVVDASFKDFRPTSTAFWFRYFKTLTAIEGLQYLNTSEVTDMRAMFYDCTGLKALDLKNFNTSNVTNISGMFSGCKALTSLDLTTFNTEKVTDMSGMFSGCSALTSLNLTSFNTEKVTNMRGMFALCSALTSLNLTNFKTSNVTDMSAMFSGCSALKSLDLKNFNTEKVEDMNNMFSNCSALKSLDLKNFNTSNVANMSEMFVKCSSLTALDLKSFKTENVTNMGSMFYGCSALTSLNLSSFNTSNVTTMSVMFGDCSTLTTLDISSFNTSEVTYMGSMFVKCSSLTALNLSSFNTSNVTNMSDMFDGCKALTSLDLSNFNTSNAMKMNAMFAHCSALTSLDLKNFNTTNVTNMGAMFYGCSTLTTLDISSFNTSNVEGMSNMFWGCKSLTSLDLSNFNTSNVEGMSKMFWSCSALKSLDLSSFNTEKVKDTRWMFADCSKLANIFSNKTWKCERSQEMFKGCTTLKGAVKYDASKLDVTMANPETGYFTKKVQDKPEVTTPEAYVQMSADKTTLTFFYDTKRTSREGTTWGIEETKEDNGWQYPAWAGTYNNPDTTTTKAVVDASFKDFRPTSTEFWFKQFKALTAIEGLQNLNTSEVTNMSFMFLDCAALTALDLKSFNTEKVTDMGFIFYGCSALTNLDLKNFNTSSVTSMSNMFKRCSALPSLDLNNFNTSNVTSMDGMFDSCSALTSLDLKNFNTEKVEQMLGMFMYCSGLTTLHLTNFNTSNVTDMPFIFYGCSQLVNIVCNNTWKSKESQNMFKGCTALKGAVPYDESKVDVTMANPETGYFTKKAQDKPEVTTPEAYVQMSADKTTLTFFYDSKRASREGTTWGINEKQQVGERVEPAWTGTYKNFNTTTTKAVFDDSFANFRPTSTAQWLQSLRSLINIEGLQNLNTSEVTDMHGMFAACSGLTTLDLSTFNTSNVTKMFNMFNGCTGLKALDLKNFNTEKVEFMSRMFKDCSALTSLDLSNFNTSNVIGMNGMFEGCSTLKELDLKSFNTSNVTNMSGMFAGSSALTSLDLKGFNTEKVKYMVDMFYGCSKLASIISNKAWNCEQSQDMFKGCTAIKGAVAYDESKVDVTMANPKTGYFTKKVEDKPEVTTPEAYVQMSADKTTLTFFYDTKRATREGTTWGFDKVINSNGELVPAWVVSDAILRKMTKVVFDASFRDFRPTNTSRWFYNCYALKQIEGLEHLNTENVTDMLEMFRNCNALTSLDVSHFNTGNVRRMNFMFAGCWNLRSLDLRNFNTKKVTGMRSMFSGCWSLTSLNLTKFNTDSVTTMRGMFDGCAGLTSLDLSKFNTQNVTSMREMFDGCSGLTSLDLNNFNTQNVSNMNGMFSGCSGLTSINLKSFKTEKVTDMTKMFAGCLQLTALDLQHFKTDSIHELVGMFKDCSGLTSLDLRNFSTKNAPDMEKMFFNCSNLTKIYSETAWTSSNSYEMFGGCLKLQGTVAYDASKTNVTMANPETGYFTKKVQDKPEVTTPEAYVQMSADKTTLTFFYDTKRASREGTTWDITSPIATRSASLLNAPAWGGSEEKPNSTTTKVVFDASFAKFYPKTTAEWFAHYAALKRIEGIENLNTSEVTSMKGMFTGCAALDTLDLTTFNTDKVNDMSEMFKNCANLSTVVCDKVWSTPHSEQMFYGCVKLLGKAAFDANKTSVEMANPNSGYFVAVKPTALLPVFSPAGANGIYTLQGKRVRGNLQHLPAGVYIVNGKKVMVQ